MLQYVETQRDGTMTNTLSLYLSSTAESTDSPVGTSSVDVAIAMLLDLKWLHSLLIHKS